MSYNKQNMQSWSLLHQPSTALVLAAHRQLLGGWQGRHAGALSGHRRLHSPADEAVDDEGHAAGWNLDDCVVHAAQQHVLAVLDDVLR